MTEMGSGYFGEFGGRYVAEVLRGALDDLEEAFRAAMADPAFAEERDRLSRNFVGRPTPLLPAENATRALGGAAIYVKLEGLANTGAHKINNALGQGLLARRMGKRRIIAETGAGQHGVATAAVCAKLGAVLPGLHGRDGHPPAEAQRVLDGALRGGGGAGEAVARARSRTRSTRRCGTGPGATGTPITCWVRRWARRPSRTWCGSSSP